MTRALLRQEADALPFILATKLGMTLGQVRAMPHTEALEWRAYLAATAAWEQAYRGLR